MWLEQKSMLIQINILKYENAFYSSFKPKEKSSELLQNICTLKCYFWNFEVILTGALNSHIKAFCAFVH